MRLAVRAPAGRQRFNVLAALDAMTHELVTVCNDSYINAASFCELLTKVRRQFPNQAISLVLDNARYQKCHVVFDHAKQLNIELLYLPAYSPNLNLIERLWKFVKKQCLYSYYYPDFDSFKSAISNCLDNTQTLHKQALDSLLTLNFQLFTEEKVKVVTL